MVRRGDSRDEVERTSKNLALAYDFRRCAAAGSECVNRDHNSRRGSKGSDGAGENQTSVISKDKPSCNAGI